MVRDRAPALATFRAQRGSVTLVALCLLTTLAIALTSYLALTNRSAQLSGRIASQEKAQQLAQVALEEALWALNQNNWTSSGPNGNTTWSTSGANRTVTLSYDLSGSGGTGQVALTIANYASTGPTWPTINATATVTLPSGQTFSKSVQATTGPAPLFNNAIASSDSYVSFVAGGTVDSWNSDPDNDSSTAMVAQSFVSGNATNYNAVVAGKTNGTYGVILTQAKVCGYVATSGLPISYSTSGSPPAKVLGPTTAAGVNIDPTRLGKSAFVPIADVFSVKLPTIAPASFDLLGAILGLVGSVLTIPNNVDSCEINGNLTINPVLLLGVLINSSPNIVVDGPTKIIVDGDFTIAGSGKLTITSTGSLQLFVTGDVKIGGNGIDNQTNDPKKLAIFCTSASTSDAVDYTSSADFCGVIFSEHKPIDIQQNGPFYGALLSRQYVRFSGSATSPVFHYDSALRNVAFSGVTTPYILKQVTEL
jgi:Tfp pilus assembly protein PilX